MSNYERVRKWAPTTIASVVLAILGGYNLLKGTQSDREALLGDINSLKGRMVSVEKEAEEQRSWRVGHDAEQRKWVDDLSALKASNAQLLQWTESTDVRLIDIGRDIREIRRQTGTSKMGPSDFEGYGGGATP